MMDHDHAATAHDTVAGRSAAATPHGLRDRIAWDALQYRIPPVANRLPYMLGGLTLFGIVVLIVTGILLDQYYNPAPQGAHDSVVYIMTQVPLGAWVRGLHYWAATIVFVSIVLHLCYVFWRQSYTKPREFTWWAGVAMFILVFGLIFTGTVLRGDQEGTEALAHATAGAALIGAPGVVMTPDFTPSTSLLSRMHSLHVSALPLILLALLGAHLYLIRHLGIHSSQPKTIPFANHLRKLTGYSLVLLAGLSLLAALAPPGLGYPGVGGQEVTKPFWPFLWIYTVENSAGLWGMIVSPLVLFGFLALVPVLDRSHGHRPRWLTATALIILLLYVGGIIYGVFAPQQQHIGM